MKENNRLIIDGGGKTKVDKTDRLLQLLKTTAKFQEQIALILEAKCREAEVAYLWAANHLTADSHPDASERLKISHDFHDSMIELIDGIAKMENSLGEGLKTILNPQDNSASDSSSFSPSSLFDFSGEDT